MDKIENNYYKENELHIQIENILTNVQNNINNNNINNSNTKICTFVCGKSGTGKTSIVKNILNKLKYNIYEFNILSQKTKNIIDFYTEYKNHCNNILDIFNGVKNKSIILIDNVELINSIDKNTLTSLIKLLRPKKNKKNYFYENLQSQIILIGTNNSDKKIKEILKLCNLINVYSPTKEDIVNIISKNNPKVNINTISSFINISKNINYYLIDKFNELNRANSIDKYIKYSTDNNTNNNVKYINYCIIKDKLLFNDDSSKINETDKTTVSLLYHENIIDYINCTNKININTYLQILQNFCFGDYMDRIIFQKQLWQLNEISFKIKVLYNNTIFHKFIYNNKIKHIVKLNNIRFTKILTKYSSEFNNYTFLINMCQNIDVDKKDLFLLFYNLKNYYTNENINYLIDKYNITSLDINRILKFISNIIEYES
tara:strand:- start:6242 stop:7531 length:1290 start_codon:yes stop_codon:yes gene_type:complete